MTGKRILLADDDSDLQMLTQMALTEAGYDVTAVSNGKEAVDSARKEKYDVILLDAEMPVMDGFQAYRTLLADPITKGTPVIFLTAKEPDEKLRKSLSPLNYILKPYDAETLPSMIRRFTDK